MVVWITLGGVYMISILTPKLMNKVRLKYYSDTPEKN